MNNNSSQSDLQNPTQIPPQVTTNIELDRKKYNQENVTTKENPKAKFNTKLLYNNLKKLLPWRKILKVVVIFFSIVVFCFGTLLLLTITNLDISIVKISLTGVITDKLTGGRVNGAEIYINDELKAHSNENGQYNINGLTIGTVNIKIKTNDYQEINQEIPINRLFLNYTTKRDFELILKEKAAIEGKIVVEDQNYKFIDDRIIIDDTEHKINLDGTYRILGVTVGEQQFNIKSLLYKDILQRIEIKPGINQLPEIKLIPSGDIEGSLLSYVKEEVVNDIKFNIENLPPENVEINGAKFKIKDLEIGREYTVQPTAPGYITRSYKITIKQGLNQIFDFRLVEEGQVIYYKPDKESSRNQFFSSDLDGGNQKKLTNFANTSNQNVYSYYYDKEENKLYFQSDKDKVSGSSGSGNLRLVYVLDLDTLQETRLTQNTSDIATLIPIFKSKKMTNISRVRVSNRNQYRISIMDLTGNNRKELKITPNEIKSILISDDGQYAFVNETISSSASSILRIDISNGNETVVAQGTGVNLFDISTNGQQVLYERINTQTSFPDLILYNFNSNEARTLNDNHDGTAYQFIADNQVTYFAQRDGRYNLFRYTISENKDERLTNLPTGEKITNLFSQSRYYYYTTPNALYIIDMTRPLSLKLVYSL